MSSQREGKGMIHMGWYSNTPNTFLSWGLCISSQLPGILFTKVLVWLNAFLHSKVPSTGRPSLITPSKIASPNPSFYPLFWLFWYFSQSDIVYYTLPSPLECELHNRDLSFFTALPLNFKTVSDIEFRFTGLTREERAVTSLEHLRT